MFIDSDISVLRFIHHHRWVALDPWLYGLSYITTFVSIGIILTLLIISVINKSKKFRIIFLKMLAVLIIAALTSFTIKNTFSRERPFVVYPDIEKLSEGGSSSFPSGHTLETFAIATALSLLIPKKKVIIPVFCWASLVAYSRMALGVHYPSDVIGGMMIGMIIGWLIPVIMSRFWKEKPETVNI